MKDVDSDVLARQSGAGEVKPVLRLPGTPDFRLPPANVLTLSPYEKELREAIGEAYDDIREGRVLSERQMDEVFDQLIDDAQRRMEGEANPSRPAMIS